MKIEGQPSSKFW